MYCIFYLWKNAKSAQIFHRKNARTHDFHHIIYIFCTKWRKFHHHFSHHFPMHPIHIWKIMSTLIIWIWPRHYTMPRSVLKGEWYHNDYHIWNSLSIVPSLIILIIQYPKRIQNTRKIMNKIIPFTNSIILYFLFPFYFFYFKFFISKFSKLKKFFQKNFPYLVGIFIPRFLKYALYPSPWCVYFPNFSNVILFHFFQNFPLHIYTSLINDFYNLVKLSKFSIEHLFCKHMFYHIFPTKSCQFNFLQVGCLRCQHPILLPFHAPSRFQ